jgi:thiol-disulfide isomerase/thioredoxin
LGDPVKSYQSLVTLAVLLLAINLSATAARASKAGATDKPKGGGQAAAGGVAWGASYGEVAKQAREQRKPMLLRFYASWCPHCAHMAETTWADAQVGRQSAAFLPVQINSEVELAPAKRYDITGIPVTILAEPGGEPVFRLEGDKDAKVILALLAHYVKNQEVIERSFEALRANRSDAAALVALGGVHAAAGMNESAGDYYLKALKKAEGADWLNACAGAGAALVADQDYKRAQKLLQEGLARSGEAPSAALLLALGRADAGLRDAVSARTSLERVVKDHAGSKEAEAAAKELQALPPVGPG